MTTLAGPFKSTIFGVTLAACGVSAANATLIYNTPGTSNITTTVRDNVLVDNARATVNINSRGTVRGVSDPNAGIFNTAVRTRSGNLNVSGSGRIIAANGQSAINMAGTGSVVRIRDRASVTGDIVNEFTTPGWRTEATARTRLYVDDLARVNGDVAYSGFMRVDDLAQIRGDIRNVSDGSLSLDMRGGIVTGLLQMGGLNDYVLNMSGGAILGGFRGNDGYVDLNMTGGYIDNGFQTGDTITGNISGGWIDGGVALTGSGSQLTIDGGVFNADPGEYLFSMSGTASTIDILGGQFGYFGRGLGFFLDEFVDFSIHGWNLAFTNGVLSGFLSDGSWFSNAFTFGSNWNGTFNIYNGFTASLLSTANAATDVTLASLTTTTLGNSGSDNRGVPEPGTLAMLAMGVFGVALFGRRRSKPIA